MNSGPEKKLTGLTGFIRRNLPRTGLVLLLVVTGILALVIGREKERLIAEKASAPAPEVRAVNTVLLDLRPGPIKDVINLPGVIEPWLRLELSARLHGSVIEVLVTEGDRVTTGQVLARIEPDEYRIAVDAARASFTLAKSRFARGKTMLEQRTIPQAELDRYRAEMLRAQAALEDAELKLSRCEITSPMDGVIRRLDAKVGLLLNIGDPVAEILEIDRVKAVVGIPETDVTAVRAIQEVDLTIQALDNLRVTGRKSFLATSPETTARLYRLELELDNRDHAILPGMFFRAHVVKKSVADGLAIPLYSVITRNNEQFVFVARDNIAHKQPVTLGIVEGWLVQITGGLKAGDQVVIEGHRDIEDGQRINVIHTITDPGQLRL